MGTAIGYTMCGGRVIPEIMYCDFIGRAGDEIFNQLPKWQAMSGNVLKMPVVVRVSVGSKYGAQHSQGGLHWWHISPVSRFAFRSLHTMQKD